MYEASGVQGGMLSKAHVALARSFIGSGCAFVASSVAVRNWDHRAYQASIAYDLDAGGVISIEDVCELELPIEPMILSSSNKFLVVKDAEVGCSAAVQVPRRSASSSRCIRRPWTSLEPTSLMTSAVGSVTCSDTPHLRESYFAS